MRKLILRSICLLLAMVMLLSMTACGSNEGTAAPAETAGANAPANAPAETEAAAPAVDPLAITPYSNGPQSIEEIVAQLTADLDLPELSAEDKKYTVNGGKIGPVTQQLYDTLTGIQWGTAEDTFGWVYPVE